MKKFKIVKNPDPVHLFDEGEIVVILGTRRIFRTEFYDVQSIEGKKVGARQAVEARDLRPYYEEEN